jgi:hypothetical protein
MSDVETASGDSGEHGLDTEDEEPQFDGGNPRGELTIADMADVSDMIMRRQSLNLLGVGKVRVHMTSELIIIHSRQRRTPQVEPDEDVLARVNAVADVILSDFRRGRLECESFMGSVRHQGTRLAREGAVCVMWLRPSESPLNVVVEWGQDSQPRWRVERRRPPGVFPL